MRLTRAEEIALADEIRNSSGSNHPAMARLIQVYGASLRGFLRTRTRRDADLEEIANDTWLRVWQAIRSGWDPRRAPLIILIRLKALQSACDHYRKDRFWSRVVVLEVELNSLREHVGEASGELHGTMTHEDPTLSFGIAWDFLEEALRIAFNPRLNDVHEATVFGLNRLLNHKPTELVQARFSAMPMPALTNKLIEDLAEETGIASFALAPIFADLRTEARSEAWREATLQSRFRQEPPQRDVSLWSDNVLRRLIRGMRGRLREIRL